MHIKNSVYHTEPLRDDRKINDREYRSGNQKWTI